MYDLLSLFETTEASFNAGKNRSRPRERLQESGVGSLHDIELISILIGSGGAGRGVEKLARAVLRMLDSRKYSCSLADLLSIKGIGLAKATLILASLEFSRRIYKPAPRRIFSPADTFSVVSHLADRREIFISVTLNGANEIIGIRPVSMGTINRSLVHPREVFAEAIIDRAACLIVAHNHPSGDLTPSQEDIEVTKRLFHSGETLGIPLLDHLLFTHNHYYSFLEHGEL